MKITDLVVSAECFQEIYAALIKMNRFDAVHIADDPLEPIKLGYFDMAGFRVVRAGADGTRYHVTYRKH